MRNTFKMNKRIIMICYYYPPLMDVGAKRSVAFAKYLKKYGWSPYVVSVRNPDKEFCKLGNDAPTPGIPVEYTYSIVNFAKLTGWANGLLSRIVKPFGIQIKRNIFNEIIGMPDFFWGWIPLTAAKVYRLIKKIDADIIYASCTPFSSALIGVLLKLLTKKPLVLDFRDPFGLEFFLIHAGDSRLRVKVNRFFEEIFLKYTDILFVTTEETRKEYVNQYPRFQDKIFTVHNGFDSEYMIQDKPPKYQKFTITYNGQFYFAHEPRLFFEALALLKSSGKIDGSNFQFLFFGEGNDTIEKIAHDYSIEDIVVVSPRVPYGDILWVLTKSHLQLLRIVKPMISTKFYEGIALNVPVLATIDSGEVEGLIKKYSPSSYVVTEKSAEKVADAILDAISKYRTGAIRDNHAEEFLGKFSRENLTLKLMNILETELYGSFEVFATCYGYHKNC